MAGTCPAERALVSPAQATARWSRRTLLRRAVGLTLGAGGVGVAAAPYSRDCEPIWVEVVPIPVRMPRLARALPGGAAGPPTGAREAGYQRWQLTVIGWPTHGRGCAARNVLTGPADDRCHRRACLA
jgi:hypothetical protein